MDPETLVRSTLALGAVAAAAGLFTPEDRPRRRELLVAAACALLAVLYSGLWSGLGTHFRAGNDPVQDAWILSTVTQNLLTWPRQLCEGNIFHPSLNLRKRSPSHGARRLIAYRTPTTAGEAALRTKMRAAAPAASGDKRGCHATSGRCQPSSPAQPARLHSGRMRGVKPA